MAEANSIMAALITSQNSPSVSKTRGKVTILRKTPRVALTKPITSAAINAAIGPLTWNPGTSRATIQSANALNAQFRRCFIAVSETETIDCRLIGRNLCGQSPLIREGLAASVASHLAPDHVARV